MMHSRADGLIICLAWPSKAIILQSPWRFDDDLSEVVFEDSAVRTTAVFGDLSAFGNHVHLAMRQHWMSISDSYFASFHALQHS